MWLPNSVQVTESSSGSVVPLAMFSENIWKTETSFFQAIFFNDDKEESSCRAGNVYLPLCSLSLPACLFISLRQNRICVCSPDKDCAFCPQYRAGREMNRKCIQFYNSPSPHVQRYLTRLSCIWLAQVLTQPKMGISTAICTITLMWVLGDLPQLWEAFNLWHIWASCKNVANVLCAEINGQILSKLRANKTKQQNSFKTKQQTLTRQILILKCSTGENKKKTWMSLNFSNFLYLNTRF